MEYKGITEIVLRKGEELYIFRYTAGNEEQLLEELMNMAQRGSKVEGGFDWFDAAVISNKLTKGLLEQAEGILKRDLSSYLSA